uniref:Uncharacterized protein n=1 Tax=Candidatus Methanogaster sp. ANME-2c ERB4 TaxID=2759911 RepID=A0A7G9YIT6_9EURY|nr:hypothetical protein DBNCDMDK_00008 [Methanosarcinales archaeon ANME-2c ERB4]
MIKQLIWRFIACQIPIITRSWRAPHIYTSSSYPLIWRGYEKEVDIVALNDNKLILIECKNHLGHTPPRDYETILDIAPFFDEVYVVNFYKPHKDVIKKMIKPDSNIKVLNSTLSD